MAPLILLVASFLTIALINRFFNKGRLSISFMGRTALAFMLIVTGIAHFTKTPEMVAMLPDFIPLKIIVVYVTGFFEFLLAFGLLPKKSSRPVSIILIVFFVCILPANIVGSLKSVELGGMEYGPAYLFFRIPLQLFFIGWAYYFGIKINTDVT